MGIKINLDYTLKTDCTGVELDGFYCTFKECITIDRTFKIDRIFMISYLGSVSYFYLYCGFFSSSNPENTTDMWDNSYTMYIQVRQHAVLEISA